MYPSHRDPHPMIFKNHQNLQNSMKENVIVLCCTPSEPDWRYTKISFPQHFMFVGLLFYIPEQAGCFCGFCCCTPPTVTPTPWFSIVIKIHYFLNSKITYSIYASDPNPIWGTQTFFPQHIYVVGLLFYISEHNDTQIGNSEFSAPSGSKTLVVVVIVVIVVVVAPLPWSPPHDFQKSSKFSKF